MSPHPFVSYEIERHYQIEERFNSVYINVTYLLHVKFDTVTYFVS